MRGRQVPAAYSLEQNLQNVQSSYRPGQTRLDQQKSAVPQAQHVQESKAQFVQVMELTYVATPMVPPLVLHCLNILTLGEYSLAGWYSAHQLVMTILSFLNPYIPMTRYQQYAMRLPFNIAIFVLFWKVVGFGEFVLTAKSATIGAAVGVFTVLSWIGVPKLMSCKQTRRRPWNPHCRHKGLAAASLVAVRLLNSSFLTAFFEEVYDRSFLYRAFFNVLFRWPFSSFVDIPLTAINVIALTAAVFCFGAGHTRFVFEPVLGMVFAVCMHCLVFCFDSLGPAVVAHSICNLLLGVYVIYAEDWMFW